MTTKTPPKYHVVVLSRSEISIYPRIDEEVKQILVTYVGEGLPPSTVTIDKDKYTQENEKRIIRADLERRLKAEEPRERYEFDV